MKYYLGIDLGTSSVKSLLMDIDGNMICKAQRGYDIMKPMQTWAQQDMDVLWNAVCETLREVAERCVSCMKELDGISFSGQMHGLVPLDKDGRPVREAIIWADQRSEDAIREIYSVIPEEEYRRTALNSISTGFLISSLVWMRRHEPENFEKTAHVLLPKDYIRYRMTGELCTDLSDAASTLIFDTARMDWAWDLIDRLDLDRSLFVPCHEASDEAGTVTAVCAQETSLPEGTRVICGGGDTIVQAIGNGVTKPGIMISNIGTSSQIVTIAEKPFYDRKFRTNTFNYAKKGQWLIMGANLSGGVALKWLKNNVIGAESFEEMDELALQAPAGSDGLLFLPYLSGERTPWNDPQARGIYFGLSLKHGRPEIIRSTMEGIIFNQKSSLEIFDDMGIRCDQVIASGGGARGPVFRQLEADMFDCEVRTNSINEQGCIGAAIIAAVGCGSFADYTQACEHIVHLSDEIVEPDPKRHRFYEERFRVFRELYPVNSSLMHKNTY